MDKEKLLDIVFFHVKKEGKGHPKYFSKSHAHLNLSNQEISNLFEEIRNDGRFIKSENTGNLYIIPRGAENFKGYEFLHKSQSKKVKYGRTKEIITITATILFGLWGSLFTYLNYKKDIELDNKNTIIKKNQIVIDSLLNKINEMSQRTDTVELKHK